ncbi:MAG: aldehyde dehydrogenase, partial [Candidatus Thermofonsia Clade 3 bacterium]
MEKLHYINGQFTRGASTEVIAIDNPANGQIIGHVPLGTAEDVDAAVRAAKDAFNAWKRVSASEKAELLHEASRKMRAHAHELIELLTREEGKPLSENEEEVVWTYSTFDYYAELGRHSRGRVLPSTEDGVLN